MFSNATTEASGVNHQDRTEVRCWRLAQINYKAGGTGCIVRIYSR